MSNLPIWIGRCKERIWVRWKSGGPTRRRKRCTLMLNANFELKTECLLTSWIWFPYPLRDGTLFWRQKWVRRWLSSDHKSAVLTFGMTTNLLYSLSEWLQNLLYSLLEWLQICCTHFWNDYKSAVLTFGVTTNLLYSLLEWLQICRSHQYSTALSDYCRQLVTPKVSTADL